MIEDNLSKTAHIGARAMILVIECWILLRRLGQWLAGYSVDAIALTGCALMTRGVGLIYPPAAWILSGAFMLAAAWIYARQAARAEA